MKKAIVTFLWGPDQTSPATYSALFMELTL